MLDEFEAREILVSIYNESAEANHIWGDMFRNLFLNSVENPPKDLTPGEPDS